MQTIIKKILLLLLPGLLFVLSASGLTLFRVDDTVVDFQSAFAAETPGKSKQVLPESGHPPLLLWRESKQKIYEFREKGIILGQFEDAQYQNIDLELKPGDRYFLYTDGIIEATNSAGERFGWDLFKEFITSHASLPVGQFADDLIEHAFIKVVS